MHATLLNEHGPHDIQPADLKRHLEAGDGTLWVDMTGPTPEDVRIMEEVFGFHPLAIEDTGNQRQRPKIEEYDDHLFIILNAVTINREQVETTLSKTGPLGRRTRTAAPLIHYEIIFRELDIFLGQNYVVTVHLNAEPVVEEARRRCGRKANLPMSAGYLVYVLLDVVVDSYFPVMDTLSEEIDELEDAILVSPRQESLNRLFGLKRKLNEVWRVASQQRDMFNVLARRDMTFIDYERLQYHLRDVYDHLLRITDMANTFRDLLTSLVDLYMSAVSNRLNHVVNRLTVITIATGTLAVITGFYGMNFEHTWPQLKDNPPGVPMVLGIMVLAVGIVLLILRRLRWF